MAARRNFYGEIEEYVRCGCCAPDHMILVHSEHTDEGITEFVYLTVMCMPTSLITRIKHALRILFRGETSFQEFTWSNDGDDKHQFDHFVKVLSEAQNDMNQAT